MKIKLNSIHENPVWAGWVLEPEYYLYYSAFNYINGKGIIEINFLF